MTGRFDWRQLTPDQIEAQFNPRVAVPAFESHIAQWSQLAATAAQAIGGDCDLRYGPGPLQTYDLHRPESTTDGAPLVILVHGGYWRGLDKNTFTFAATPFLQHGAVVANLNYDLCPAVTLDIVVHQMQAALAFCAAQAPSWGCNPARIHIVGHSAGAHLAAMMAAAPWPDTLGPKPAIASLGLISGVYELEPVLHVSVNAEIRLDDAMARRNSVMRFPPQMPGPVLIAVGDAEPEGWQAQSVDFHQSCRDAGTSAQLMRIAGANHFSIINPLAEASSPLATALLRQCGLK